MSGTHINNCEIRLPFENVGNKEIACGLRDRQKAAFENPRCEDHVVSVMKRVPFIKSPRMASIQTRRMCGFVKRA